MKKKKIVLFSFLLVTILLCTACDGNVTRDIRHAGYAVGNKFKCDDFSSKKKDNVKKAKYFTGTRLIDTNGEIYETSMGQVYSNNQNCRKAKTNIKVSAILDNKIVKGEDSKYYYLEAQNSIPSYGEIKNTDHSYVIYDMLLKGKDVVKAMTVNSNNGLYYVLKTDGNIYGITISKDNNNSAPKLRGTNIVFDKSDYDSEIIDFNYVGNSLTTYIRTEDSLYRMKIVNSKECNKYVDVACKYEMKEDTTFKKHQDRIIIYNGSTLITDYNMVFNIGK